MPGRAAYRGRTRRLVDAAEFLGVDEDAIREGIRRIGEVVREQVACTAPSPARARRRPPRSARSRVAPDAARAPTSPESTRGGAGQGPEAARPSAGAPAEARPMSRVAVLKGGRSLERQVSLRSGARVQDALERLGHEVVTDRRRSRSGR